LVLRRRQASQATRVSCALVGGNGDPARPGQRAAGNGSAEGE